MTTDDYDRLRPLPMGSLNRGDFPPRRSYHEHRTEPRPLRISPAFPTIAESKQRLRNSRAKRIGRLGLLIAVSGPLYAFGYGTGILPAALFGGGLVIFAATCIINGRAARHDT